MSSLSNFTTQELMNIGRLRIVDGYENISRQLLENISAAPSTFITTSFVRSRFRPRPRLATKVPPTSIPRPKTHLNIFQLMWMSLKK